MFMWPFVVCLRPANELDPPCVRMSNRVKSERALTLGVCSFTYYRMCAGRERARTRAREPNSGVSASSSRDWCCPTVSNRTEPEPTGTDPILSCPAPRNFRCFRGQYSLKAVW